MQWSLAALLMTACASGRDWVYVIPENGSATRLRTDLQACVEESKIVRLAEQREILERSCMNDHGYVTGPAT